MAHPAAYQLLPRSSTESTDHGFDVEYTGPESRQWSEVRFLSPRLGRWVRACMTIGAVLRVLLVCLVGSVLFTPIFNPSYTQRPVHYAGTNPRDEKVFIAASIVNADLISGAWGNALIELAKIIGVDNVFVSIYENDSGGETKHALQNLSERMHFNHSITSEHFPFETFPTTTLHSGEKRIKRISFLANIRNRAMAPFYNRLNPNPANSMRVPENIDKVLFLNDIIFSPTEAADLLFSTYLGSDNRTHYRAACAMDFINPLKFYDTFATRDLEGYKLGVPWYPWFSTAGERKSRDDVLSGTDSVRVRSCWGGMVAFEARWLDGVRFRDSGEAYWEASECCLVHADIQTMPWEGDGDDEAGTGVFVNPFVRVAYDQQTFRWLEFARRFERLYALPHRLVSWLADLPARNSRRTEEEGDEVVHLVWSNSSLGGETGCYRRERVRAQPGGFCGEPEMQVLRPEHEEGQKTWEKLRAPRLYEMCANG